MPTKPRKSRAQREFLPREPFVPEPVLILGRDVLAIIHDWEDVDGDRLTEACRNGDLLTVDE